ncbi:MAG: hypothetical protein ACE14V_03490 [bacterium]
MKIKISSYVLIISVLIIFSVERSVALSNSIHADTRLAQISTEDKTRAEQLKKADAEETKVREERAKLEVAARIKEAEQHYQMGMHYLSKKQFIKAHEEWETTLTLIPAYSRAKLMLDQTRTEYEQELELQRQADIKAKEEVDNEQKMLVPVITMEVANQELGDVLVQMGAIAGFNIIIGEGIKTKVSFSASHWSLKQALESLLPLYGFKYVRTGNTIQIVPELKSKVYTLNEEQVRKLHYLMIENRMLQDYLYGKNVKPQIAGQQLSLDERTYQLIITDTQVTIDKLNDYLTTNLPEIQSRPTELVTKTFILRRAVAEDLRKAIVVMLEASPVPGVDSNQRKVILEPGGNTLVIRDSLGNIKKVEKYLAMDRVTTSELVANVYRVVPQDLLPDPKDDAVEKERKDNLRKQTVTAVTEILEAMLHGQDELDYQLKEYPESGRRLIPDVKTGTISVVDTKLNQKKVADYIAQLPKLEDQPWKIYKVKNVESNDLLEALRRIMQGPGGGGGIGSAPQYTLTPGTGNGITFGNLYVELVSLTGDTANPSARIYWRTASRDGDNTLTLGQSVQADTYRIRLVKATFSGAGSATIEIWQIQANRPY